MPLARCGSMPQSQSTTIMFGCWDVCGVRRRWGERLRMFCNITRRNKKYYYYWWWLPQITVCGMVWQSKFPVSRFIRSHTPTLARPLGLLWTSKETDGVTGTCWQLFWRQLSVCCRVGCSHISSRSMSKEIVSNSTSYVCTLSDVIELLKLLTAAFRANDNSWKCWQQKMMGLRAQPTMTTEAHQKFLLLRKSHFSHLTIFVWLPISSAIICLYTTIASYRHDVIQAHDV